MASLPPAGWYPDPDIDGESRYWTGTTWAPQVSPVLTADHPSASTIPSGSPPEERVAPQGAPAPSSFMRAQPNNTMATVALVLGLGAFVLGLIAFFGVVTRTIAVPAAILGAVALRRQSHRGRATAGLVLGL